MAGESVLEARIRLGIGMAATGYSKLPIRALAAELEWSTTAATAKRFCSVGSRMVRLTMIPGAGTEALGSWLNKPKQDPSGVTAEG